MTFIFEITDASGKRIHLTAERWEHIVARHSELGNKIEEIRHTVVSPSFQVRDSTDPNLYYNHTYIKEEGFYLVVAVKYLNGEGFVITAFYSKRIKK